MSHLGLKGWNDVERVIDEKNAIIAQLERTLAQAKTELREATWRPTARISELNWELKDAEQELDQVREVLRKIGGDNHPYIQFWYAKLIAAALDPTPTRDEIDPNLQMCIECGTQWTADEPLPCPTPDKHPTSEVTVTRATHPALFAAIDDAWDAWSAKWAPEAEFKLPDLKPGIRTADVTGHQPLKTPEATEGDYKTSNPGYYWETGFCQNCSKVRYNVDNEKGLCGWCAEYLYPLEDEESTT